VPLSSISFSDIFHLCRFRTSSTSASFLELLAVTSEGQKEMFNDYLLPSPPSS